MLRMLALCIHPGHQLHFKDASQGSTKPGQNQSDQLSIGICGVLLAVEHEIMSAIMHQDLHSLVPWSVAATR